MRYSSCFSRFGFGQLPRAMSATAGDTTVQAVRAMRVPAVQRTTARVAPRTQAPEALVMRFPVARSMKILAAPHTRVPGILVLTVLVY